jgi:hypothetical protein
MRIVSWIIGVLLCVLWVIGNTIMKVMAKPIEIKTTFNMTVTICDRDIDIEIPVNLSEIGKGK